MVDVQADCCGGEDDGDFVKRAPSVYKWGRDFSERIEGTNKYRQIRVGFPDHAIIKGYFKIA